MEPVQKLVAFKVRERCRLAVGLFVLQTASSDSRSGRDCTSLLIRRGADLAECDLAGASLRDCVLARADVSDADLSASILAGCVVAGTNMSGANVLGVISGGLAGTPSSLPLGWTITDGVLTPINGPPPNTTFTVVYGGNANTGGTVPVDGLSPYESGVEVTVLGNTGGLRKTGSTFGGWNTAADGAGTSYSPAATFTISADTVLYAQWVDDVNAGLVDPTFGPFTTGASGVVNAVAVQGDGKILIGGSFTTFNGTDSPRILRLLG